MLIWSGLSLAASFTVDNLNLREALPQTNPPKAYFKIDLEEAWSIINDSSRILSPIIIGIVDTGIDTTHPEFFDVKLGNTPEDARKDIGVVSEGLRVSHGTNVAGIIGANNISSISPGDYVFPHMNGVLSGAKQLDYTLEARRYGGFRLFAVFSAVRKIYEVSRSNPQIVNLSLEAHTAAAPFFAASFDAHPNVLFVVAAGNSDKPVSKFSPAELGSLNNVLTVGAVNLADQRLPTSNFGSKVGIAAPGEEVLSPTFFSQPDLDLQDYDFNFNETSAATPFVTGVAGLIKAIKPELSPAQIKHILVKTADPIQTGEPDKRIGTGCYADPNDPVNTGCRLNAHSAVCHPDVLNCAPFRISAWPMFQRNAQHTGLADVPGPPFQSSADVSVKWQRSIGTRSSFASPLVATDGTVYAAGDNVLVALHTETGEAKWQSSIFDGDVTSGAIGPDGTLYICALGSLDRSAPPALYALDPSSGDLEWRVNLSLGGRTCHPPVVASSGTVFIAILQSIFSPPIVTIAVFAINPDGTERWRHEEPDGLFEAPTAPALSNDESHLYVSFGSDLLALQAETGQALWRRSAPRGNFRFAQAPTVDSADRIIISTDVPGKPGAIRSNVVAFSRDGDLLWQSEDLPQITSSSALNAGGAIFVVPAPAGVSSRKLFVLDPMTGATVEQFVLPGFNNISAPAIDADGVVYIGLFGGFPFPPETKNGLAAVGPEGLLWFFEAGRVLLSPAIGTDGTVFFIDSPFGEATVFALGL